MNNAALSSTFASPSSGLCNKLTSTYTFILHLHTRRSLPALGSQKHAIELFQLFAMPILIPKTRQSYNICCAKNAIETSFEPQNDEVFKDLYYPSWII